MCADVRHLVECCALVTLAQFIFEWVECDAAIIICGCQTQSNVYECVCMRSEWASIKGKCTWAGSIYDVSTKEMHMQMKRNGKKKLTNIDSIHKQNWTELQRSRGRKGGMDRERDGPSQIRFNIHIYVEYIRPTPVQLLERRTACIRCVFAFELILKLWAFIYIRMQSRIVTVCVCTCVCEC